MSTQRQMHTATILVTNTVRWCNNILVEVLGNHGEHLEPKEREKLRDLVDAFSKYERTD